MSDVGKTEEMQRWADEARARVLRETPDAAAMVYATDGESQDAAGYIWGIACPEVPEITESAVVHVRSPLPEEFDPGEIGAVLAGEVWKAGGRVIVSRWREDAHVEREFKPPSNPSDPAEAYASYVLDALIMCGVLIEVAPDVLRWANPEAA